MKKITIAFITMLLVATTFIGCSKEDNASKTDATPKVTATATVEVEPTSEPVELTIMAAASLTDVAEKITELYKEVAPNVTLTFSYGASGALQTQIEEGAPADLFFSAASKQMDALEEGGLLLADTRLDLLINKIVLIVPKDSTLGLESFEDVGTEKVKMVALGEPAGVPVGQYAEEVFTSLTILDIVKAKANYGTDVRQVLTWVETNEVDCGVVYATDAQTSEAVTVVCEAPEGSHKEVVYPAAVLGNSTSPDAAKAFLDFLSTEEVKTVFEEFGFTVK